MVLLSGASEGSVGSEIENEQDQPTPDKAEIQSPRVIVEVLSPCTEAYDRGEKFGYYRACPHVQEYVLIATKYQTIEVYRRTSSRWLYDAYGPGDEIELTSLDIRLPLTALYRNAGVPEALGDPEGESRLSPSGKGYAICNTIYHYLRQSCICNVVLAERDEAG